MLSETDREILIHLLERGNDAPLNIADGDQSRSKYVMDRLNGLEEKGLVEPLGSGVWALTEDGLSAARAARRDLE